MSMKRLHSSLTAAASDLGGERGLLCAKRVAHPGRSSTRKSCSEPPYRIIAARRRFVR
jgi:hypothetical protein